MNFIWSLDELQAYTKRDVMPFEEKCIENGNIKMQNVHIER